VERAEQGLRAARIKRHQFLGIKTRVRHVAAAAAGHFYLCQNGPALLEDPTSTLYVPAGWAARRDDNDNTVLTRD